MKKNVVNFFFRILFSSSNYAENSENVTQVEQIEKLFGQTATKFYYDPEASWHNNLQWRSDFGIIFNDDSKNGAFDLRLGNYFETYSIF